MVQNLLLTGLSAGVFQMPRTPRRWVYSPAKVSRVPESVKEQVAAKANEIIEGTLKPEYLKPPPEKPRFNYVVDIYSKWHGSFFYFCAKYACPGAHAISPHFEHKFARVRYLVNGRFNLAYMRHTGQWWEVYSDLFLDEAFAAVRDERLFQP